MRNGSFLSPRLCRPAARPISLLMKQPTLFIPHGGGPCFFMDPAGGPPDPMWRDMQAYLGGVIASLPERPRAMLMISGHWEEDVVTAHVGSGQPLLYDYYGF